MSNSQLALYDPIGQCLTLSGVEEKKGKRPTLDDLGIIENAAMVVDTSLETIVWVGKSESLPARFENIGNVFSGENEVWLPELVECHTHLVHAGFRHHDYSLRVAGQTYQQIAQSGGGILTTLKSTRNASLEELVERGLENLERFQRFGVGTIEIKTGYGLTLESEIKLLEAIREIKRHTDAIIVTTFMPAHATPPEFKGKTDMFVDEICEKWIPLIAKEFQPEFFDVFVEEGYFSVPQARKLCTKAKENGLGIKLHSDQFNDLGGTALAVELGARSVDHLEEVSETGIELLASSSTVGVLCPGASLFTGTRYSPARKLIDAGVRVALSTDFNPGTCPSRNLPLMTTLACSQMGMTIPEALTAITYNAAAALNLENRIGTLTEGKRFRVFRLRAESFECLPYCFGEL